MKNKLILAAVASTVALASAGAAGAQTVTFNTTGNTNDNGTYGNALTFPATTGSLQLRVTGWQANQSNNHITTAYVGAYSPGMGVTGLGDNNGADGYHQIDNAGGYTDFMLLQFSSAVTLQSLTLNSFTLGTANTKDTDFAWYAASVPEAAWNSAVDLTQYDVVPSLWTTVPGSGADTSTINTGATALSRQWLVGAAFNSANNDGFKIKSLTVTTPVPEPASWAMMILGMGMVGYALRRRTAVVARPALA